MPRRPDAERPTSTPGASLLPVALPPDAQLPVPAAGGRVAATGVYPPDHHPALVYLASLAPGSRRTMRQALDVIAAFVTGGRAHHLTLPWHQLRYPHTTAVRGALAEHYAPATANKMLAALRGVLREAWRLGFLDAESHARAADLAPVRGTSDVAAGRELSPAELRALLEACAVDPSPAGVRDAAILALLYGAGLRRAEAARLMVDHVDADAGTLRVHGKGARTRQAYARGAAAGVLRAWLAARGPAPGRLLLPVSQRGEVQYTRQRPGGLPEPAAMTEYALYLRLKRRATEAGVRPFTPHDCRRTFIGDLLDAGADISTVQRLAGHASVTTTARYDRRGERAKRDAADLLRFPHVGFGAGG